MDKAAVNPLLVSPINGLTAVLNARLGNGRMRRIVFALLLTTACVELAAVLASILLNDQEIHTYHVCPAWMVYLALHAALCSAAALAIISRVRERPVPDGG